MVFKNICVLELWTKVASALEGVRLRILPMFGHATEKYGFLNHVFGCPKTCKNISEINTLVTGENPPIQAVRTH